MILFKRQIQNKQPHSKAGRGNFASRDLHFTNNGNQDQRITDLCAPINVSEARWRFYDNNADDINPNSVDKNVSKADVNADVNVNDGDDNYGEIAG